MTRLVPDQGRGDDQISIRVFQNEGLLEHTRRVVELACRAKSERDRVALATAAVLMAGAAVEALIMETAYIHHPILYQDKKFRHAGVPHKFDMLMKGTSADCALIWSARTAVSHSEPDHRRSREVGVRIQPNEIRAVLDATERVFAAVRRGRNLDYSAYQ